MSAKNFALGIAAAALLASPVFAGDLKGEMVNAIEHAQYSADATDIATAHMHLHHSLNCIVGPKGAGFDAAQMNPCAHSGDGIIPDSTDAKSKPVLEAAAGKARDGIATNDLATAKADAVAVGNALKSVK